MLGHMFKFAIHRSALENSPVQLLYRPGGKPRRRKRVLSEEELRSFVTNIDSICRTWKIPASHSKNKREHAVPLTRWAIAELKAIKLGIRKSSVGWAVRL